MQIKVSYGKQWIDEDDEILVSEALNSDFLTQGPMVDRFESALAEYLGAKHAIVVSNGTTALYLLCQAIGMDEWSHGITTAISFVATANCIVNQKSKIIFCDVDSKTGLMDYKHLEETIEKQEEQIFSNQKKNVKCIIPVSMNGRADSNLPKMQALAKKHGYFLIEDAAHSLGGSYEYEGKTYKSGSCAHTDASILSFHPVKSITSGEGGAIITNNSELADKLRLLRSHGIIKGPTNWENDQVVLSGNYRLTDIQCALGLSQLKKLDMFIEKRRELADRYRTVFSQKPFAGKFTLQPKDEKSANHLFVLHFKNLEQRAKAYEFLKSKNIFCQVHYKPIYLNTFYRRMLGDISLPGAQKYGETCLSIPLYPKMELQEQDYVCEYIRKLLETENF